jgi:16S rRNA (cytosine967-C5)-methyltransferase
MPSVSRQLAFDLLTRIEARRLHSDAAVNSPEMAGLDVRDRHLATEIIYGVLRHRGVLDWLLRTHSSRPWQGTAPGAKIILRMGLYQLWKMDRVPDHALVNDAVDMARHECGAGVAKYVNGILRQLARLRPWERDGWLSDAPEHVGVSLPSWLWGRWRKRFGRERAREFALSLLVPPAAAFRLPGGDADEAGGSCLCSGFRKSEIVPGAYLPDVPDEKANEKTDGRDGVAPPGVYFQDEASQLVPFLAGPLSPGSRVWDACAAPGGKSAIIAEMAEMAGTGTLLVASDMNLRRVEHLRGVLANVSSGATPLVFVADARFAPPFRAGFDLVCADVPCSGLGTLRRNPEIKWRIQPEDLKALQKTQARILASVASAVRPGGRLLYSTCSTEPEENEQVVGDFLETHGDFQLETPPQPAGIERWTGKDRMVRTFPSARLWDGFFAARLRRER